MAGVALTAASDPAARERELRTEISRLRGLIDRDRTGLAAALDEVKRIVASYWWVTEGRGPYAWDDDQYRLEMKQMLTATRAAAERGLKESGRRADSAFHPEKHLFCRARDAEGRECARPPGEHPGGYHIDDGGEHAWEIVAETAGRKGT